MSLHPFSSFTVDGFRGLRSLQVEGLRGINIFVGGNNSGKTSILEALSILANPVNGDEWLQVVRRRDFGRLDESPILSLRWCFDHHRSFQMEESDDLNLKCQFTMEGKHPLRAMHVKYREFLGELDVNDPRVARYFKVYYRRDEPLDGPVKTCTVDSELFWSNDSDRAFTFENESTFPRSAKQLLVNDLSSIPLLNRTSVIRRGALTVPSAALLPYSYQLNSSQVRSRSGQLFQDDNELLLDLVRQFDDDVLNIEVASFMGQRPAIYIKHKQLGVAPLSVFGDAMRRSVLLASTLINLGPGGVLFLDEVEVGIHTDALPRVFKWLAEAASLMGVQVMATTHSLEVVDALLATNMSEDDLAAFQISQGPSMTECRRFSGEMLKRLRFERGLDIR